MQQTISHLLVTNLSSQLKHLALGSPQETVIDLVQRSGAGANSDVRS
jgi:hypothetical protein